MLEILPQLLACALITGSIYALASAGLALTCGVLKIVNFAHGHIMMAGAYTFFFFHVQQQLSLCGAILATLATTMILASLYLSIFILPFNKANSLLPVATTIALGAIIESAVSLSFGVNVHSFPIATEISESMRWGGVFITGVQIFIISSALVILGVLAFVIHVTPLGRRLRALAENPQAAESLGTSVTRVTFCTFIASTLLAGYAGILIGYESSIQPTMGSSYSLKAFAAVLLGGLGSMWGTMLGAYLVGLIESLAVGLDSGGFSLSAGYKDAFAFVIILLILLGRPQGLLGTKQRLS